MSILNKAFMLTTLLLFILILGLLVFVHEFGHYWAAKRSGVQVHEFAFGFRPRVWHWHRNGTDYSINLLPLGGYVRLEGEQEDTGKAGSLMGKSIAVRLKVIVAGVIMNLILAYVFLVLAYGVGSVPLTYTFGAHPGVIKNSEVSIAAVEADSPAAQAGLQDGDIIVRLNQQSVQSAQDFAKMTKQLGGQTVTLEYARKGVSHQVDVPLRANPPEGQGALGVVPAQADLVRASWIKSFGLAFVELGSEMKSSFVGFGQFVSGLVRQHKVSQDVSGLVGIGAATGIVRRLGLGSVLQFIALISANLAVVNMLPILPLDGGHFLFTVIEGIQHRPVKEMYRQWVAMAGLFAILLLFVVVTYRDFINFSILDRLRSLF